VGVLCHALVSAPVPAAAVADESAGRCRCCSTGWRCGSRCPSGCRAGCRHLGTEHFGDAGLQDQALTIFISGIETSSYPLAWVCHLLSRHPEVHDEVTGEIVRVLGGRAVSAGDLPELGALRRVITETLRLHPPVWLLFGA
jgi:hypothetical protein